MVPPSSVMTTRNTNERNWGSLLQALAVPRAKRSVVRKNSIILRLPNGLGLHEHCPWYTVLYRESTVLPLCTRVPTRNMEFWEVQGYYAAPYYSGRTTKTGQCACRTTESETLPSNALVIAPTPRLPITIMPTSSASAARRISLAGSPLLRWVSATFAPSDSSRSACCLRNFSASL